MKVARYITVLVFFAVLPSMLLAQTKVDWENPELPSQNALKPHAWFIPYGNIHQMNKGEPSSLVKSLDGKWKFKLVNEPTQRPDGFHKDNYDLSGWSTINVPANWQTEGFDRYIFTDVEYPIPPNPPYVPKDFNPVGSYKRTFTVPESWTGKQVNIHLGAVNSFFYLWINGQYVGFSKDSKTPAEFDITKLLRKGQNSVAIQVFRFSDGTYLEGQDMWKLSGIERSVYLVARAPQHIYDYSVKAGLINGYKDGRFDLRVSMNKQMVNSGHRIKVQITDPINTKAPLYTVTKQIGNDGKVELGTLLPNIKSWNAEQPNLYNLQITHYGKKGEVIESLQQAIGFRNVELKGGLLLINGVAIKIKGVNRHEHSMYTAKVVSEAEMITDIRMMKQLNINAVRASHYPNTEKWYALCQKYGLYIIDEANIECDGMSLTPLKTLADKPEWKNSFLDRTMRMVERDKNFCSIIIWSLGNESEFGENFIATYNWIKQKDSTRPVQYEATKDIRYSDIFCPMYKPIKVMEEYVKEWRPRPMIQCEYAHMMGNSGGNLKDDWDLIYKHKQLQGGFIWDLSDQTFKKTDANGRNFWAYGKDMGIVGITSDTSFCADGLLSADRTMHPQAYELQKVYQNIGFDSVNLKTYTLNITNRFDFSKLDGYAFKWYIKGDGQKVAEGTFASPAIEPHGSAQVTLNVPVFQPKEGTVYYLFVEASTKKAMALLPTGYIIAKEQFRLPVYKAMLKVTERNSQKITVTENQQQLSLNTPVAHIGFNKATGLLSAYSIKDVEILKDALKPHFWRAATDNDIGNSMQIRNRLWQHAFDGAKLVTFESKALVDGGYTVSTKHYIELVDVNCITNYNINADGEIQVHFKIEAGGKNMPELPRVGMRVILQPAFDQVTWLGKGPFDNYWDRGYAAHTDVYSMKADSLFYPYPRAQESGYRTEVQWMALLNDKGMGLMAIGIPEISTGVLHFNMDKLDFDRNATVNNHGGSMGNEDMIWWNIDYRQMGVGGDNAWGAKTHPQYTLPYKNYEYSFILRPIYKSTTLADQAK